MSSMAVDYMCGGELWAHRLRAQGSRVERLMHGAPPRRIRTILGLDSNLTCIPALSFRTVLFHWQALS